MRQMEQGRYATAHTNFILCRDIDHMAITINELSKNANLKTEGDLFVARLVKGANGKGITVQISPNQFGFIEMAEITDDLVGSVIETLSQL